MVARVAVTVQPMPKNWPIWYILRHWRAAMGEGASMTAGMATMPMVALPPRRYVDAVMPTLKGMFSRCLSWQGRRFKRTLGR